MTWEWSHTQAGYDYVRDSISNLAIDKLKVIWAEIRTFQECLQKHNDELRAEGEKEVLYPLSNDSYFDKDIYDKHLNSDVLSGKSSEDIAEEVWKFAAEEQRECDNGGFNAYICPYHCHALPFSRVEPKKHQKKVQISFLGGGTDVEEDEIKDLDDPTLLVVEGSGKRIKMQFIYSLGEHEYLVYSWDEEETLVWRGDDLGEAVEAYNKI